MNSIQEILKQARDYITVDNFRIMHDLLVQIRLNGNYNKYSRYCEEIIQLLIDYIIYGEKMDESLFDAFCELNLLNEFIYISANCSNRNINLQIIKSLATLILTITNKKTLYFIFSNNIINQIISSNDFEQYDEEFHSFYVNFLKSLSLKIDQTTLQFFFQKKYNSFPLLESALKLYNHNDSMIKNTVRNIFLTFLKLEDLSMMDYFCSLPCIQYFALIACHFRDIIRVLNTYTAKVETFDYQVAKSIQDDLIDDVLYLQDIFSLNKERINIILINCLFHYFILPLLCGSLRSDKNKRIISQQLSIYVICIFIHLIKKEEFINILYVVIMSETIPKGLFNLTIDYPKAPINYHYFWVDQKKCFKESFEEYITTHFNDKFICSLVTMKTSPHDKIQKIAKAYEINCAKDPNFSVNHPDFLLNFITGILKAMGKEESNKMITYHNELSNATGVILGLENNTNHSFFNKINKMFLKMKEGKTSKYIYNEIRKGIFECLNSNDENLIVLVNVLIHLIHNKNIPKELLSMTNLLSYNDIQGNQSNDLLFDIFDMSLKDKIPSINQITETKPIQITYNNQYFQSNYKINQRQYNSGIVDFLLNVLLIDKLYMPSVNHLITSNLMTFLFKPNSISSIDQKQLKLLQQIYYSTLTNIKLCLVNNLCIKDSAYAVFENEWRKYSIDLSNQISKNLITLYYLISPKLAEHQREESSYKTHKRDMDQFNYYIMTFMCLYDLKASLLIYNNQNCQLISNKFPLGNEAFLAQIDEKPIFLLEGEHYKCQMKKEFQEFYTTYTIIIYLNYFFFCIEGIIKEKYALREMESIADKSNINGLNIEIREKQKYLQLNMIFENEDYKLMFKKQLDELRKKAKEDEVLLIEEYFDKLIFEVNAEKNNTKSNQINNINLLGLDL